MWQWMLARLTVITLQYIQIRNHYVEHLKLMLYVNHSSKNKNGNNLHFSGEAFILLVLVCSRTQLPWGIRGAKSHGSRARYWRIGAPGDFWSRHSHIYVPVSCHKIMQDLNHSSGFLWWWHTGASALSVCPYVLIDSHLKWSCPCSATLCEVFHFRPGVCITC